MTIRTPSRHRGSFSGRASEPASAAVASGSRRWPDTRADGPPPPPPTAGSLAWSLASKPRATALLLLVLATPRVALAAEKELLLATTTSVQDSGLLDSLLPRFTTETGIRVQAVAVGSGAALRMGAEGNADVLLTHAPAAEEELLASGAVVSRVPFMENFFVLAGPAEDPAGARDAPSAAAAFKRIRDAGSPYVSRGDDSGTHRRERQLLEEAGLDPAGGWPAFTATGAGMGVTLMVAGERRAYVLSDIGTFLAFQDKTELVVLSKGEPSLRNVYSILRVSPERFPKVNAAVARTFEAFLLRPDIQELVAGFGRERFGQALFHPLTSGQEVDR